MNILSFLPRKAPQMADEIALPASAEGLPQIAITDELLAAARTVEGLRDTHAHAVLRRVEELHGKMPGNRYQMTRSDRRDLADSLVAQMGTVPEIQAELAGAERTLIDLVTAAIAAAHQRALNDAEFQRQREHEAAEERRRQREAERQHAEERRGFVTYANRDGARIKSATGAELWVQRADLAMAGWPLEVNDHVRFEIEHRGGRKFATQLQRLQPSSTDPWED